MTNTYNGKKDINTHVVFNNVTKQYELISLDTGEVVSSGEIGASHVFEAEVAILIAQKVREGVTLSDIGKDPNFPEYSVISHWRRMHPMFDDLIRTARKDRAEGYHDKIIAMADELNNSGDVMTKEAIASKKISMDAYKWAAEKNDPDAFGKKQEIRHENTAPTTIVVNTGIQRHKPDVVVAPNQITEE